MRSVIFGSYVVRFWQERVPQSGPDAWCFVLEMPDTGERRIYSNVEKLLGDLDHELRGVVGLVNDDFAGFPVAGKDR